MKSFILGALLSCMTLFPSVKDSTLKDITKPYIGEYECKSARLGDKDYLEGFSYIRLELKDTESFVLHCKEKDGKKRDIEGKYHYDKDKGVLTVSDKSGVFKREFPLEKGNLTISLPIGEKILLLQFEQK